MDAPANLKGLELSSVKRRLLEQRLAGFIRPAPSVIARWSGGEDAPLSFSQQRLWFLDQLVPGNPFYNVPAAIRLPIPVDATILERCLNVIVTRHEVLRTTFAARDGQPVQRDDDHLRQLVAEFGRLVGVPVRVHLVPRRPQRRDALR